MEPDEFEEIPWSTLVAEQRDHRAKFMYTAAAVLAAIVLGVVAVRIVAPASSGTVVAPPPTVRDDTGARNEAASDGETLVDAVDAVDAVDTATGPAAVAGRGAGGGAEGTETTGGGDLLSEADLMAVLPESEMRAASAWAEIIVTDFFTVDGANGAGEAYRPLVAEGGPELPHGIADGVSYVEWARTLDILPIGPGSYGATVAFGLIVEGERGFVRQPVRAVRIELDISGVSPVVLRLPEPAEAPRLGVAPPPEDRSTEMTEAIAAAAAERIDEWGTGGSVWWAADLDDKWLVMGTVDIGGIDWPVSVILPAG